MTSLFDPLGPAFRAPDVSAALESLAADSEVERGAVFTRPEVAAAILDLCGYTADRALHRLRLLEPSFGGGEIAPALRSRIDLERRAVSCKTVRNFMVHPGGGVSGAAGWNAAERILAQRRRA